MITASVMTVTTRRVVELMPRLTHHSSAQLITTGTMISSCNAPRIVGSARTAGAACADANSTTDLDAGVGAVELDETRTIGGARIAGAGTLQRQQPARGQWFVRLLTAGRLSRRGRQHRNDDRKEDVSHPLLLSPLSCRCYRTNLAPTVWPRRQTTSQLRPVLASRANATRKLPGNTMGSSVVIFAPVLDKSSTMHWRVAKPPSKVIHPGWRSDLRGSRGFISISASISVAPSAYSAKADTGFTNRIRGSR